MSRVIRVADKFINIRGSFKLGPADIGVHTSLVKRQSGKWLMLDSVKLESDVKAEVDAITNNGADLEAILNLHPFHTVCFIVQFAVPARASCTSCYTHGWLLVLQVSCSWVHDAYPSAKLYGSSRHHAKLPSLPWEPALLDDPAVLAGFKDDLDLRIPQGTVFELSRMHASSIQILHGRIA